MQDKGDRNGVINHFVQFLQGHTYRRRRRQRQSHFFCKERGHAVLELNLCGSEQKSEEREKKVFAFCGQNAMKNTHTHMANASTYRRRRRFILHTF